MKSETVLFCVMYPVSKNIFHFRHWMRLSVVMGDLVQQEGIDKWTAPELN